jgi:hypothetical protein
MTSKLWDSFRDELIATSMVLVVAMSGSFYVAHRVMNPPKVGSGNSGRAYENTGSSSDAGNGKSIG